MQGTMHNQSLSRTSQSQIPSLPPLIPPWHQDNPPPNRPLPPSSNGAPNFAANTSEDFRRDISKEVKKQRSFSQIKGCIQEEKEPLESTILDIRDSLQTLAERVSLQEKEIRIEKTQIASLVQSARETERRMLNQQQNVTAKSEEQDMILGELSKRLDQLEQRQKMMAVASQRSQEEISSWLERVSETFHKLERKIDGLEKKHITMERALGDEIMHLKHDYEKKHDIMRRELVEVGEEAKHLKLENKEIQKQMEIWLSKQETGMTKIGTRLEEVASHQVKQDNELRKSFHGVWSELSEIAVKLQETFAGQLKEIDETTIEHKEQLMDALFYFKEQCFKGRESIKKELETRITATEESIEAVKMEHELELKKVSSVSNRDAENIKSDLMKEIKGMAERGEMGKKVLQGAMMVAEGEAEATRQDLLTVIDAEIRTRTEEVKRIWEELQRLSNELNRQNQSVKTSLEIAEEKVTANRDQVQMLQDSLVREWQEVGAQLLRDIDSKLSEHITINRHRLLSHPHTPKGSTIVQSQTATEHEELTPYINFKRALHEETQSGTPLSQASYLIDEYDHRSNREESGEAQKHQLKNARKYSSGSDHPLHSKSCILSQDHSTGRYSTDLPSLTEEEPATPYDSNEEKETERAGKTAEVGDKKTRDHDTHASSDVSDTPLKTRKITHPLVCFRGSTNDVTNSEPQVKEPVAPTVHLAPSAQNHGASPEELSNGNRSNTSLSSELTRGERDQGVKDNDQEYEGSEDKESPNVVWRIGESR